MDLDGTLYEKGSRWSGALASLVKRSVIKISRQGEREREKHRSIDADSGPSVFFPSEYWCVQSITAGERRRGGGETGMCVQIFVCQGDGSMRLLAYCACLVCVSTWLYMWVAANNQHTSVWKMRRQLQSGLIWCCFKTSSYFQVFYLPWADTTNHCFLSLLVQIKPLQPNNEGLFFCG